MESITAEILNWWGAFFFSEHWQFQIDSKTLSRIAQKFYCFWDNFVWIGNAKFSLLLREYLYLPINVLWSSSKFSDLIENKLFLTQFGSEWRISRIRVLFCRFQEFLGLVNTFIAKGFSERSPLMHLNKHILRNQ